MATPHTAYPFDSIIICTNTSSMLASVAARRIAILRQTFPGKPLHVLKLQATATQTQQALCKLILREQAAGRQPVLGVAGGDGTVNTIVNLLANPDTPEAVRATPLVPLGTGNANDLACMLYGNPSHPEKAFLQGKPVAIRPLSCRISTGAGQQAEWLAASYISFGAIAHGAHELNKPAVRKLAHRRTWYSGVVADMHAVHAALDAPTFTILHQGKKQRMRDVLVGNGERMAKVGRMPAHIDRSDLFVIMVQHTWIGRWATPLEAFKLMIGRAPGQLLLDTAFEFQTLEDVYAQYDGEPAQVRAGCTVHVTHAQHPFLALSTRLAA